MASPRAISPNSFLPKRVVAAFENEPEPLESHVSECIPGVVLCVRFSGWNKSQIHDLNRLCLDLTINLANQYGTCSLPTYYIRAFFALSSYVLQSSFFLMCTGGDVI